MSFKLAFFYAIFLPPTDGRSILMSPTNHVRMCEHVYHTLEVMSVRCWGKKIKQYLREWPSEIISSLLSDGTDGRDGRTDGIQFYSSTGTEKVEGY